VAYKLYAEIISRNVSDPLFNKEQNGFRRKRPCMENIIAIQQVLERDKVYDITSTVAFLDYVKASDSVLQDKLWELMNEKGFLTHLIRTVQSMYQNITTIIRKD
jgi:hypothetical protein